jgi:hypothetical protein
VRGSVASSFGGNSLAIEFILRAAELAIQGQLGLLGQ